MENEKDMLETGSVAEQESETENILQEQDKIEENVVLNTEDEFSGQEKVEIHYHLNYRQALHCLKYVDRKQALKKRMVYTVILAALGIYFFYCYFIAGQNIQMNIMLAVVCLAMLFVVWLVPLFAMRSRARAYDSIEESFVMRFYESGFTVGEEQARYTYYYTDDIQAFEDEECIMLFIKKERIFPIPKENIQLQQQQKLQSLFAEKLGERYHNECNVKA